MERSSATTTHTKLNANSVHNTQALPESTMTFVMRSIMRFTSRWPERLQPRKREKQTKWG
jgi:hypothetical protein